MMTPDLLIHMMSHLMAMLFSIVSICIYTMKSSYFTSPPVQENEHFWK